MRFHRFPSRSPCRPSKLPKEGTSAFTTRGSPFHQLVRTLHSLIPAHPVKDAPSIILQVRALRDKANALFVVLELSNGRGRPPTSLLYRLIFLRPPPRHARHLRGLGLSLPLSPPHPQHRPQQRGCVRPLREENRPN